MKKELKQDLVTALGVAMVCVGIIGAIYPLLYELGKAGIAFLFGADLTLFKVFPWVDILVNVTNVSNVGRVFTCCGGMVLPVIICLAVRPTKLWLSFAMLFMHLVSLCGIIEFMIAVLCCRFNMPVFNQDAFDAYRAMRSVPGATFLCVFLLCGLLTALLGSANSYEVSSILNDICD